MSLLQTSTPRHQPLQKVEDRARYAAPRSSIYEVSDAFVIQLDVPGVDQGSIDIQMEKNLLSFTAERKLAPDKDYSPVFEEFSSVIFQRRFDTGELIDVEHVDASYANGVVTIRLPKRAEVSVRRIPVTAA